MMFVEIDEVIDLLAKREDPAREWGTFGEDLRRCAHYHVATLVILQYLTSLRTWLKI